MTQSVKISRQVMMSVLKDANVRAVVLKLGGAPPPGGAREVHKGGVRNAKISTTYIVKHAFTTTALDNQLLSIVEDATICYSVSTLIHYNIFIFTDILGYKT